MEKHHSFLDFVRIATLIVLFVALFPPGAIAQETSETVVGEIELSPNQRIRVQQHLIRGLTRAFQGDFDEAIMEYQQALKFAPEEPAVLSALADAYAGSGEISSAIFFAREASRIQPQEFEHAEKLSELLVETGDHDGAIATLTDYVNGHPENEESRVVLIATLVQLERHEQAITMLQDQIVRSGTRQDVAVGGKSVPILELMADSYSKTDQITEWWTFLSGLATDNPQDRSLQVYAIEVFRNAEQMRLASDTADKALSVYPNDAELVYLRDLVLEQSRDRTNSDPNAEPESSTTASVLRGLIEEHLASVNRMPVPLDLTAFSSVENEIRTRSTDPVNDLQAVQLLARSAFSKGNFSEAAALFEKATKADGRLLVDWAYLIESLRLAGNLEDAQRASEMASLLFPGQVNIIFAQAGLAAIGNPDEAIGQIEVALEILSEDRPDDIESRARLIARMGDIYNISGDGNRARDYWSRALSVFPDLPDVRSKLNTSQ